SDVAVQAMYVEQQLLDGAEAIVRHAQRRKIAFDRQRVLGRKPGETVFLAGDLVQVRRSDLEYTFKTEKKIVPMWSAPVRVVSR
ncbi:hypothetical protein F5880DRAFT_1464144, partial [Lentinula raphanica]